MSNAFPDWLRDLAPEDDEPLASQPAMTIQQSVDVEDEGMMDDLRRQMGAVDTEPGPETARPAVSSGASNFGGLVAWQRFVLSLFLFLDVAVVGMMFLVMLGRIVIP
ncbi:MAG: hypothetical protein JXA33_14170 [Anaerolineae bacterium]|nr:hypothetical protein [Anaerolineae bacterium]